MAVAATTAIDLLSLPEDAILRVLENLTQENLITVGFACKSLYRLASTDSFWMKLCNYWQKSIDVKEWRRKMNSGKALFRLLSSFQKLIGVWSAKELYPRGGILYINWGNLCLIAARIWTRPAGDVILRSLFEVTGLPDGSFRMQLFTGDEDFKFPAKLIWSSKDEMEFEFQLCESNEASSLVNQRDRETADESSSYISGEPIKLLQRRHLARMVKSLGPDHRVFGARDEILDENANLNREQLLHRFHPGNRILSSSNRINNSAYTKLKVDEAKAGQELAGLWSGIYGPHGLEIVNVSYTDDEILVSKLLGDPNVPCSEVTFKVTLSSMNMDARMDFRWTLMGLGEEDTFNISRMYKGSGRIANYGFHEPKWVPGRLLVQRNGNMAFLWEDVNFVINFRRLHLGSLSSDLE